MYVCMYVGARTPQQRGLRKPPELLSIALWEMEFAKCRNMEWRSHSADIKTQASLVDNVQATIQEDVLPDDVLKQHILEVMSMLIAYGAISLRAVRKFLQLRLNINLMGRRSDIRRLAMIVADELASDSQPAAAYAPVWEALSVQTSLGTTLAPHCIGAQGHGDRGRCLFSFLSDVGDAFGHAEGELHSSRWHDGPSGKTCYGQSGNGCWELFCLEHGMQPDGQLPPDQAADCNDEAVIASPKVSGEIPPMPHGVMADLSAMVVDDVCTGISRQPFPTELFFTGMEDAAHSFGRGCYAMRPKFVDPDAPADNNSRLQPGQVRSDWMSPFHFDELHPG